MAKRHRFRLPLAGGVLAVLLAGGCAGEDGVDPDTRDTTASTGATTESTTGRPTSETTESPSSTTSPTSSTAPTPDDDAPADEQEIVNRYLGFWQARWAANSGTPDPDHADLAEFATDEQLDAVVSETQLNLERGLSYRAADEPVDFQRVQVLAIEANRAVVQECVVDDGLVVRTDTGEVVDQDVTMDTTASGSIAGTDARCGDQPWPRLTPSSSPSSPQPHGGSAGASGAGTTPIRSSASSSPVVTGYTRSWLCPAGPPSRSVGTTSRSAGWISSWRAG